MKTLTINRLLDLYNIKIQADDETAMRFINQEIEKRQQELISKHLR